VGFLNLTQLVGEVQASLLNRTDLSNDRCVTALNFAQTTISRAHDFKELFSFFTGSTQFTGNSFNDKFVLLAPLIKHIHTAVLIDGTNSRKLVEKPWRQFDKTWPMPEALGRSRPQVYSRWGPSIIVYPVPDAVYPVFCRISTYPRPFNLTAGPLAVSDYEWKDDIILKLACAYLWKAFGRPDKADDLFNEVGLNHKPISGLLGDAIRQDQERPDLEINIDVDTANLGEYWANPFIKVSP